MSKAIIRHNCELAKNMIMKRTLQKGRLSPEDVAALKSIHGELVRLRDVMPDVLLGKDLQETQGIAAKVAKLVYSSEVKANV